MRNTAGVAQIVKRAAKSKKLIAKLFMLRELSEYRTTKF
jgi:hypothetical protein